MSERAEANGLSGHAPQQIREPKGKVGAHGHNCEIRERNEANRHRRR
jgi:hypothetical protein